MLSGNYNGTGEYIWACGKKYTGTFVSGVPSGEGTLIYPQVHTGCPIIFVQSTVMCGLGVNMEHPVCV